MAVSQMKTTGLDKVLRNLNRRINAIEGRTKGGLAEAAMIVQGRSMELTPHDTGHLEGSAYVNPVKELPQGPTVEIGYWAAYALYVHETDRNYKRGQWKFLETALKEMTKKMLAVIRHSASKGSR